MQDRGIRSIVAAGCLCGRQMGLVENMFLSSVTGLDAHKASCMIRYILLCHSQLYQAVGRFDLKHETSSSSNGLKIVPY
jgi:hypothetical protein